MSVADVLSMMLDSAGDKLGDIYSLVLDESIESLGKTLTMRKEMELLESILEVNDIPFLWEAVKRIAAKFKKVKA